MTASTGVPRRQAATTPVSVPITIEKIVPSSTIGSVLMSAVRRFARHRLLVRERHAEIAAHELLQVDDVLLALGLVEPELLLQREPQSPGSRGGRARGSETAVPGARRKSAKLIVTATKTVTTANAVRLMT